MRRASSKGRFWIVLDVITVVGATALATIYKFRASPVD
jgi:Tfp pilus assembly protein PilN